MELHDQAAPAVKIVAVIARGILIGAPRHLSQHPGGFVLTRYRLDDLVPIEPAAMKDRQVIEWDKDDIDVLRFMKVECPECAQPWQPHDHPKARFEEFGSSPQHQADRSWLGDLDVA